MTVVSKILLMGRNVLIECFFVYVHFGTEWALKFFLLFLVFCDSFFTLNTWTKAALRSHCDTHNNNKPYSCVDCSVSFSTKQYHMKNLLETHNTAIQFNCTICNIAFQSKSIFNRHSKQHYIDHVSLVRKLFGICWFSGASQV